MFKYTNEYVWSHEFMSVAQPEQLIDGIFNKLVAANGNVEPTVIETPAQYDVALTHLNRQLRHETKHFCKITDVEQIIDKATLIHDIVELIEALFKHREQGQSIKIVIHREQVEEVSDNIVMSEEYYDNSDAPEPAW